MFNISRPLAALPVLAAFAAFTPLGCAADASPADTEVVSAESLRKPVHVDAGVYENRGSSWVADEFGFLSLTSDGTWVRTTCEDDTCTSYVAQDGHYVVSTSGSKTYLFFYVGMTNHPTTWTADPKALQDVYQVRTSASGLSFRKAYTSHWFTLSASTSENFCGDSGGTWEPSTTRCTCVAGSVFIAGEGGCVAAPVASESLCDSTKGSWTDDDTNLLQTYCDCGVGRAWVDGTGCASF